jgi:hypothetical protein
MGEMRNEYKIFNGKPERKRPFGRRTHRWEHIIITVRREVGCEIVNWIHLAQDRDQ